MGSIARLGFSSRDCHRRVEVFLEVAPILSRTYNISNSRREIYKQFCRCLRCAVRNTRATRITEIRQPQACGRGDLLQLRAAVPQRTPTRRFFPGFNAMTVGDEESADGVLRECAWFAVVDLLQKKGFNPRGIVLIYVAAVCAPSRMIYRTARPEKESQSN